MHIFISSRRHWGKPFTTCLYLISVWLPGLMNVVIDVLIHAESVCSGRMDFSSRLLLWQQLAESCGLSTIQQSLQQAWRLLLLCLLCRLCFRLGESYSLSISWWEP